MVSFDSSFSDVQICTCLLLFLNQDGTYMGFIYFCSRNYFSHSHKHAFLYFGRQTRDKRTFVCLYFKKLCIFCWSSQKFGDAFKEETHFRMFLLLFVHQSEHVTVFYLHSWGFQVSMVN